MGNLVKSPGSVESGLQMDVLAGSFAMAPIAKKDYFDRVKGLASSLEGRDIDEALTDHANLLHEVAQTAEANHLTPKTPEFAGRIILANTFASEGAATADSDKRQEVIDGAVETARYLEDDEARKASRFTINMMRIEMASTSYLDPRAQDDDTLRPVSLRHVDFYDYSKNEGRPGANRGDALQGRDGVSDLHYREMGMFRTLNKEEETILGRNVRAGQAAREVMRGLDKEDPNRQWLQEFVDEGEWSRDVFIESNMRLASSIVKKLLNKRPNIVQHLHRDDLQIEAELGIITAVDKFEPDKGYKFSTYATWWVEQTLQRAIIKQEHAVDIPAAHLDRATKVRGAIARWRDSNTNPAREMPAVDEIVAELDGELKPEQVQEGLDVIRAKVLSADAPLGSDEGDGYSLSDTEIFSAEDDTEFLGFPLDQAAKEAKLSDEEKIVISLSHGIQFSGLEGRVVIVDGQKMPYEDAVLYAQTAAINVKDIARSIGIRNRNKITPMSNYALRRLKNTDQLREWVDAA